MTVSKEHNISRLIKGRKNSHYLDDNHRSAQVMVDHCPERAKQIGHRKPYEGAEPIRIPKLSARVKKENSND